MAVSGSLRVLSLLGFLLLFAPFYQQCVGMKQTEAPAEEASVTEEAVPIVEEMDSITLAHKQDSIQKAVEMQFVMDSINAVKSQDSLGRVTPFYKKIYFAIDDESNENAYEMGYEFLDYFGMICTNPEKYWKEFKESEKEQKATYIVRPIWLGAFGLIVLFTFIILIAAFSKKAKMVYRMARLNVVLLFLALGCIFLDCWFEKIDQIKWGYYAFTIVQILMVLLFRRQLLNRPQK